MEEEYPVSPSMVLIIACLPADILCIDEIIHFKLQQRNSSTVLHHPQT